MSTFGHVSGMGGATPESTRDGAGRALPGGVKDPSGAGEVTTCGATSIRIANEKDDSLPAGHSSQPGGGSFVPQARKSYDFGPGVGEGLGVAVGVGVGVAIAAATTGCRALSPPHGFTTAMTIATATPAISRPTYRSVRDEGSGTRRRSDMVGASHSPPR